MITNTEPIKRGNFLLRENDFGYSIIINSSDYEKLSKYAFDKKIYGLEINSVFGHAPSNLDFLKHFSFIRAFRNVNVDLKNIEGIYNLHELTELVLGECSKTVDFTLFKSLHSCYFKWVKNSDNIFDCKTIKKLGVEKLPFQNFSEISLHLPDLEEIGVGNSPQLKNLSGFDQFNCLIEVSLSYCRNFEYLDINKENFYTKKLELYHLPCFSSLEGIQNLKRINELNVEGCQLINSIDKLADLISLKSLSLNNLKKVDSFHPLKNLMSLEELFFIENTDIIDGDLTILKTLSENASLKNVYFMDRKHYNLKRNLLASFA